MRTPTMSSAAASTQPPRWKIPRAAGIITSADSTRTVSDDLPGGLPEPGAPPSSRGEVTGPSATPRPIAAIARAVFGQRAGQGLLGEIGPIVVDEDELRIGRLPQQEIAEALFAARPDDDVRIRNVRGLEMGGEELLIDGHGLDLARLHLLGDLA